MDEYLIKQTDGDWLDIEPRNYESTLVPKSLPWQKIDGWGDFRIKVNGCEISFSYEDVGIQIVFENDTFAPEEELQLLNEILLNITEITGQKGKVFVI